MSDCRSAILSDRAGQRADKNRESDSGQQQKLPRCLEVAVIHCRFGLSVVSVSASPEGSLIRLNGTSNQLEIVVDQE